MDSKVWLIVLVLAFVAVVESSTLDESQWGISRVSSGDGDLMHSCNGRVGDCISDDEEHMLGSESDRRQLYDRRSRYVSYEAMKRNNVPCNQRGQSYYNCRGNTRANPYNRGCSYITRCARYLG